MQYSAVFIGAREGCLRPGLAAELRALLPGASALDWLAPHEACELGFSLPNEAARRETEADLRERCRDLPIDIGVLQADGRRKRLLVADMDATIIGQECLDELGGRLGLGEEIAAITAAGMAGTTDFETGLRQRLALLAGAERAIFHEIIADRLHLNPGAATLVATMRSAGAHTALVSSGFTIFTEAIAARAGFAAHEGNEAVFESGRLTAEIKPPLRGEDAKRETLFRLANQCGITPSDVLAVGDGANDRAMIEAAGLGVAFHAKPVLRAAADVRIEHADLTALLYLQGYRKSEFVQGAVCA
jgi:phosphoserine phosphatase